MAYSIFEFQSESSSAMKALLCTACNGGKRGHGQGMIVKLLFVM